MQRRLDLAANAKAAGPSYDAFPAFFEGHHHAPCSAAGNRTAPRLISGRPVGARSTGETIDDRPALLPSDFWEDAETRANRTLKTVRKRAPRRHQPGDIGT